MELDKETERKLEMEDLERAGAWQDAPIEPFPAVQTIPASKIHHEKEPLRAGKEEAIEHKGVPSGGEVHVPSDVEHKKTPEKEKNEDVEGEKGEYVQETEPGLERLDSASCPSCGIDTTCEEHRNEEKRDKEEASESADSTDTKLARHGSYPQFIVTEEEELLPLEHSRQPGEYIPTPPSVEGLKKRLGLKEKEKKKKKPQPHEAHHPHHVPPPPPIEGLKRKTSVKKPSDSERKKESGGAAKEPPKMKPQRRWSHPSPHQPTSSSDELSSSHKTSDSKSNFPIVTSGLSGLNPPQNVDAKRMDQHFQLDVLKMRLDSAIQSRDEVLKRWATHEALRDRNIATLEEIRHRVAEHFEELTDRVSARDGAVEVETEARRRLDEAHTRVLQLEQARAECEAKHLGEKQMCNELERRIKDHTTGIMHAMSLKQKRELEVKDLEVKIQLAEHELHHSEFYDDDLPLLYHNDYTSEVQVPTRLPPGSNPTDISQLPVVSTQSTVTKEAPISEDDIVKSAIEHNVPLPSTMRVPHQIETTPTTVSGHYVPNIPPVPSSYPLSQTLPSDTSLPSSMPIQLATQVPPQIPVGAPPLPSSRYSYPSSSLKVAPSSLTQSYPVTGPSALPPPNTAPRGPAPHSSASLFGYHPPYLPPPPSEASSSSYPTSTVPSTQINTADTQKATSLPQKTFSLPIGPPPPLPPRSFTTPSAPSMPNVPPNFIPMAPTTEAPYQDPSVGPNPTSIPIRFGQ